MFQEAKWIWLNQQETEDEYASFIDEFEFGSGSVVLRICAEMNYIAFINERRAVFGQFPNYLKEKYVDEIDITEYCHPGKNTVRIIVRYEGINTLTHIKDKAGVIYEVSAGSQVLTCSDESTLGGYDSFYQQHVCRLVTMQLGYSVNMINSRDAIKYGPCREATRECTFFKRPVEKLVCEETVLGKLLNNMEPKRIYDFGEEIAGYLILDVECEEETELVVAYGEHLADGEVRQLIDGRDFSFQFQCTSGNNHFELLLFRIAGRYVEVKCEKELPNIKVGIMPVSYPAKEKNFTLEEPDRKIYETCIRTLKLCMHEHYEDCPWREQALYVLDGRNQMLSGYYAFDNSAFARANIVYMSKGKTQEGLLTVTFPTVEALAIPFFSLMYPVVVYEYIKHTGDETILNEVMETIDGIMKRFRGMIDSTGLIRNFSAPYWNFYEWSNGSCCATDAAIPILHNQEGRYDLLLNCAFLYAFDRYWELCHVMGKNVDVNVSAMRSSITETFYDEAAGCYFLANEGERIYSQLGNAFAKLVGLSGRNLDKAVKGECDVVPVTLPMLGFVYDALLDGSREMNSYILSDIRKKYGYMLQQGATCFWETMEGEAAFQNAGSLCHGWSALPVYYYNILFSADSVSDRAMNLLIKGVGK